MIPKEGEFEDDSCTPHKDKMIKVEGCDIPLKLKNKFYRVAIRSAM